MDRINQRSTALGPYDALLFDMDGTILNSTAPTERAWTAWSNRAGVSADLVLAHMPGRRAIDTVAHFASPGMDIAEEVRWIDERELADLDGVEAMPGGETFLHSLPASRWAVVTSANRALAKRRIAAAGLPLPSCLVTCDDVSQGKPHPEGYLRAAIALGYRAPRCLVFEDAEAGLRAGVAAGSEVICVTRIDKPRAAEIRASITGYENLSAAVASSHIHLHLLSD